MLGEGVAREKVALRIALQRLINNAGFPTQAAFVEAARALGCSTLTASTLSAQLSTGEPGRNMDWHFAQNIVKYCCLSNTALDPAQQTPRIAGLWSAAHGRPPEGYDGLSIAPTPHEIAVLCDDADIKMTMARDLAAAEARLETELAASAKLLTSQHIELQQALENVEVEQRRRAEAEDTADALAHELDEVRALLSDVESRYHTEQQRNAALQAEIAVLRERQTRLQAPAAAGVGGMPWSWFDVVEPRPIADADPQVAALRQALHRRSLDADRAQRWLLAHYLLGCLSTQHFALHDLQHAGVNLEVAERILTAEHVPAAFEPVRRLALACTADPEHTRRLYDSAAAEQRDHHTNTAFDQIVSVELGPELETRRRADSEETTSTDTITAAQSPSPGEKTSIGVATLEMALPVLVVLAGFLLMVGVVVVHQRYFADVGLSYAEGDRPQTLASSTTPMPEIITWDLKPAASISTRFRVTSPGRAVVGTAGKIYLSQSGADTPCEPLVQVSIAADGVTLATHKLTGLGSSLFGPPKGLPVVVFPGNKAPSALTITATRHDTSRCTLDLRWDDPALDVRAW